MPISLPENITKNLQNTKNFFGSNIDAAVNTVNQNTQQAKSVVRDGITSATTTLKESLQTTVEKIDNLNQTLSDGIQASVNSTLNGLINNNPQLFWLINHPLQALGISLLGLVLFSGLIGAISNLTEKFWLLIITYPFKLISNSFGLISNSFQKDNQLQKNISIETENQKSIAAVLSRLEANRQEQNLLLQELESLLNP